MSGRGRGRNTNARGNARNRSRIPRAVSRRQSQDDINTTDRQEVPPQSSNSSSSSSDSSAECPHVEMSLSRTLLKEENVLITDQTCKQCGKLIGTTTSVLNPNQSNKRQREPVEVPVEDAGDSQASKRAKTHQDQPVIPQNTEPVILTREQKASQDWKSMTRTTFLTQKHQLPASVSICKSVKLLS